MNCFRIRSVPRATAVLALLVGFTGRTLCAQQGSVTGQVTDKTTQQPIAGAQVLILGTSLQALTSRDGRYTIAKVPAGRYQMQTRLLGYASATVPVTVAAEAATANFAMTAAAVPLDVVIVSAIGQEQTKREIGNAVAVVDAAKVIQEAAPDNASDLFNSRVPGVVVQQAGGTTGTSSRIRIRGATSLALSNEPEVIVDGVRIETNPAAINFNSAVAVGGQTPSRLNDIPTEDIQSFEVVKGPSAAVLYGTDAANGVISITTQHGKPGPTRFNASVEGGALNDVGNWPANYEAVDASGASCPLAASGPGGCTIANVKSYNPLVQNTPFRTGVDQHYNMNASGGNDVTTFYVSGDFQREKGIYSSSDLRKTSVRANLRDQVSDKMDLTINTGYITSNLSLPQNDNNNQGILSSGLLGFPDTTNGGYGFATPSQITQIITAERVERFIGGATANYRPVSFLALHGTIGYDATTQGDDELTPPNTIPLSASQLQGNAAQFRGQIFGYTGSFTTTATARVSPRITSNTSVGASFYKNVWQQVQAAGRAVVAGTQGVSGVVFPSVHDTTAPFVTLGGFAEEDIAFNERLYLTGAVRGDQNSSFGQNFTTIFYPKVSGSWVISEEPFFPQLSWLSSLRLRAAWGKSGRAPAPLDALQFSTPVAVALNGTDVAGITIGSAGNANLKPEQTREFETGFDADALQQRLHFEATYYDKDSKDALVDVPIAGSLGVTSTRLANLGEITNQGVELLLTAQVLNTPDVSWSLTASAWGNKNRVLSTGPGNTPVIFGLGGSTQRLQVGYPAGGYWGTPYSYTTVGGIVQPSSITFSPGGDVFQGSSAPTHGGTISTEVNFLRHFRVYGLLDGRFGNKLDNATESFRCLFGICAALNLKGSAPADQAAALTAPVTETGFFQDAGFVKLREVSVTYSAPAEWASRIGASSLSFTVTGRNLVTWTSYKGLDPEINTNPGIDSFSTADFLSQPPVRYFLTRVNVTF